MKRINNLYDKIYELKNLYSAYYKARRRKQNKSDIIEYSTNLEKNIKELQNQLIEECCNVGNYKYFKINDPKERIICAADFKERVLHHAIVNILDKYFENYQIFDTYACRKDKGTHKAVKRAYIMAKSNECYLKLDIRKYFDSVDHNVLKNQLRNKFKDKKLLKLLYKIIDSYNTNKDKGIPIGNLTSQYFANFYLSFMDKFIKNDLRIKSYVRYMDDFIIFNNNSEEINEILVKLKQYLQDNLLLQIKPPIINKTGNGAPFLGFKIYNNKIILSKRSKTRFKNKFIEYERNYINNKWSMKELIRHIEPLIGWTKISKSIGYRNFIIKKYGVISE